MSTRRYVIVGGGMTADAAAQSLRTADPSGQITILAGEKHAPYSRPPLSKALWKGEPLDSIWRGTEKTGAQLLLGRQAVSIDRKAQQVKDDQGELHSYDALLLATGGAPVRLPFGGDGVIYFRTIDDFLKLKSQVTPGRTFAVIGGGFIGSEIAAALRMNGANVVLFFPEEGVGARVFPADMSGHLVSYYRDKGVHVQPKTSVKDVVRAGTQWEVVTGAGQRFQVDAVVAGVGIRPNVELAKAAGLEVDNGIVVDEQLRTSDPHIFAAGDVASFPSKALGRRTRVEHEDGALSMGSTAGLAMAGKSAPYTHVPFFYSDLFELGYEAVGMIDSRLETVARWKEPFREGTVYYVENGIIRGVLLVNTWGQVDAARELIVKQQRFTPDMKAF